MSFYSHRVPIIFSKCYNAEGFFRPLPIRTYVSNKCLLQYLWIPSYSADGGASGENLFQKEGSPSKLRKTLTLSKKRSRML